MSNYNLGSALGLHFINVSTSTQSYIIGSMAIPGPGTISTKDDTTLLTSSISDVFQTNTFYPFGLAYSATDSEYTLQTLVDLDSAAYDGSYDANTDLRVLTLRNCGVFNAVGLIRNVRRYDLAYTAAKAKIDELMV